MNTWRVGADLIILQSCYRNKLQFIKQPTKVAY